jgi:hypothetical protein
MGTGWVGGAHRSDLTMAAGWTMVAVQTRDHRRRRWGHRGTTCSCVSPRSGGEAGGAWTMAGDGEVNGEEATGEEVLGSEVIAVESGLKLVLDEEEVMAERIPSSDGDGEGWWWPATVSRGERLGVEQSRVRHACEGNKVEEELLLCPHARTRPHAHVGRRLPVVTGAGATTARSAWSPMVTSQMVCVGGTG